MLCWARLGLPHPLPGSTPTDHAVPLTCPCRYIFCAAASPPGCLQLSVFEMSRLLATELAGDSEDQLFYGAAASFIPKLAEVCVYAMHGCMGWQRRA